MRPLAFALGLSGMLLVLFSFTHRSYTIPPPPKGIVFKDTSRPFLCDSLTHRMGNVPRVFMEVYKYFKYTGRDPGIIQNAWTGDPHYICEYPKESLRPGQVYGFKVCFCFTGKYGRFDKTMGFTLVSGENIVYRFTGNVVADPETKKDSAE